MTDQDQNTISDNTPEATPQPQPDLTTAVTPTPIVPIVEDKTPELDSNSTPTVLEPPVTPLDPEGMLVYAQVGDMVLFNLDVKTQRPALVLDINEDESLNLSVFIDKRLDGSFGFPGNEFQNGLCSAYNIKRGHAAGTWSER